MEPLTMAALYAIAQAIAKLSRKYDNSFSSSPTESKVEANIKKEGRMRQPDVKTSNYNDKIKIE